MRHSLKLWNHYKSYKKFFKANGIKVEKGLDKFYYDEFCTSRSLRVHSITSQTYFDYFIHRLHMLGTFNMFDYGVPLSYKGYNANYAYDAKLQEYVGHVEGEFDSAICGKTLALIEDDFHNMVDYVIKMR